MLDKSIRAQLAKEVRLEDLQVINSSMMQLIDIIGLPAFVEMSHAIGGMSVYIPKAETVVAAARNRLIGLEFDGSNYDALAKKYDISEIWVRQIINKKRFKDAQILLFD